MWLGALLARKLEYVDWADWLEELKVCDYHYIEVMIMDISNTGGMKRRPTHPGEMLREGLLADYDKTVTRLAEALGAALR